MSSSGEPRLKRFGGKGAFSAWKLRVLAYLQTQGLKETVTVNSYVPEEKAALVSGASGASGSSDEDRKKAEVALAMRASQQKKRERAYALLVGLLDDNVIDLVAHVEAGDAYGVWKVLSDTYEAMMTEVTSIRCLNSNQSREQNLGKFRRKLDRVRVLLVESLVISLMTAHLGKLSCARSVRRRDILQENAATKTKMPKRSQMM